MAKLIIPVSSYGINIWSFYRPAFTSLMDNPGIQSSCSMHVMNMKVVEYYFLTPWSRVLLEKLTGSQLVKKFPTFY